MQTQINKMRFYSDAELATLLDNDIFRQISQAADSLGVECYVVGGYVRDLFLERPSKDIDVVVVGSGIEVAEKLSKTVRGKAKVSIYRNFGTAQVHFFNHGEPVEVEFVGARKESYQRNSRKPIVEDGTLEDDISRRDFTINAMAICLNKEHFGELVDMYEGLDDLEDRLIRTPLDPDITFSDDPLRMLRCVRFASQLNFFIDEETFDALVRNAERLKIISWERIADELNKIMMSNNPSKGIYELYRAGLLEIIMPELTALDIVENMGGKAHKNNFHHTMEVLDNVARNSDNLWLRYAALLHDIGKAKVKRWEPRLGWTFHNHDYVGSKMVETIFKRIKLPLDSKMRYVEKLVALHMRPIVIADEEVTDSAVRRLVNDAGDDIDDLMTLCEADITSKNAVRKQRFLDNFKLVRIKIADLKERDYKRLLQPVINGNEIMEMFGLKQSPVIGVLKKVLKDAVLDNTVENEREPLMKLLIEKAKEMGLTQNT